MAKRKDIYEYLILGWNKFHFVQKKTTNYNKKLTDNHQNARIFIDVFQQKIGIPMGTDCATIFTNLLLYSYEAYFIHGFLKNRSNQKLARLFYFTFHYIDDIPLKIL